MKAERVLKKAFGTDEFGFANITGKIGNIKVSRFQNAVERGGCTYCFPHGFETTNSHLKNMQRSWKKHRNTQWKV